MQLSTVEKNANYEMDMIGLLQKQLVSTQKLLASFIMYKKQSVAESKNAAAAVTASSATSPGTAAAAAAVAAFSDPFLDKMDNFS